MADTEVTSNVTVSYNYPEVETIDTWKSRELLTPHPGIVWLIETIELIANTSLHHCLSLMFGIHLASKNFISIKSFTIIAASL